MIYRDPVRAALATAADDLDKAANQFEGLYRGILCQYVESGVIPGVNAERFAEKAASARAALAAESKPVEITDEQVERFCASLDAHVRREWALLRDALSGARGESSQ